MDLPASENVPVLLLRRPKPPKPKNLNLSPLKVASPSRHHTVGDANLNFDPIAGLASQGSHALKNIRRSLDPLLDKDLYETSIQQKLQQEVSSLSIHPSQPKGPDFFPPGRVFHKVETLFHPALLDVLPDEIHLAEPEHDFTLNDFNIPPPPPHLPYLQISHGTVSRENYLRLTGWFATNFPTQESVNTLEMSIDQLAPPTRVPKTQILVELQALVKKILEESPTASSDASSPLQWPAPGPNDALFKSATSKFFCGQARNDSPFDADHQPFITPSEAAIVESMMCGGSHLSLKAHFIDRLPLLTPLAHTLISLNLSYNSLKVFPKALLQLKSLVFLSMRNNPVREIPNDIKVLQNVHFLCFSFCNLSILPSGLFDLCNIVDLDVSYNNLELIPRRISQLKRLRKLNVEGNQLPGLPASALCLTISHLLLGNNLMHPLLWRENTKNQPQSLADLCCVVVKKSISDDEQSSQIPVEVQERIQSYSSQQCDECGGNIYGAGLRLIRNVLHSHFTVKNLPFIFTVCSSECSTLLRRKPANFWLDS